MIQSSKTPPDQLLEREQQWINRTHERLEAFALKKSEKAWRKEMEQYFSDKRSHNRYLHRLFSRPIHFKTKDGKQIRILSQGFDNMFAQRPIPPRAFVCVFVDGKRIYFYRSSGEASKLPGRWFPTPGPEFHEKTKYDVNPFHPGSEIRSREVEMVGKIRKMSGHPSPNIPPIFRHG